MSKRTFDDVIESIQEHQAQAWRVEEERAGHPLPDWADLSTPYPISKEDALIALEAMRQHFLHANGVAEKGGLGAIVRAINCAEKDGDYSHVARLLNSDIELMGVKLVPGWGERKQMNAVDKRYLRACIYKYGGEPDQHAIFHAYQGYTASVVDWR